VNIVIGDCGLSLYISTIMHITINSFRYFAGFYGV